MGCSPRMLNSSPWGRAGCMAVWRAEHWGGMDRLLKLAMGVGCVGISQHCDTQHMMLTRFFRLHMVKPARVCAISCVVEGKLTVISARVIYRLGALCDSRGLRSPTVCYPLTASALELFPTHHTTRGRACLLPFTLAMRFVHAMWRCDMPLAEYKHGRVGTLM